MRIQCPFCGERDLSEFVYLGDATCRRPQPEDAALEERFLAAVYVRDNPDGIHQELWYHVFGCRSWLQVTRDTCTHAIFAIEPADRASHR